MDLTHSQVALPKLAVNFVPILWEPYIGSGEKVVALLAIKSNETSSVLFPPKAYSILPEKRLVSMLGKSRGASAHAILFESAKYLSDRLQAGLNLLDALPPFAGFTIGCVRRSSGYSIQQILESATRSVSAFGSIEDIFPDEPEVARHATTTREFLARVRKSEFGTRVKERFNKKLRVSSIDENAPEVTIDYCYEKFIVQATSLPSNNYHDLDLRKEAESKLFEIVNLRTLAKNDWHPKLFLNVEAIELATNDASRQIASKARSVVEYFANAQDVDVVPVTSADDAIAKLSALA